MTKPKPLLTYVFCATGTSQTMPTARGQAAEILRRTRNSRSDGMKEFVKGPPEYERASRTATIRFTDGDGLVLELAP